MRTLFLNMTMSLDGYIAGLDGRVRGSVSLYNERHLRSVLND